MPITETDNINVGFRAERTDITLFDNSPPSYVEYVAEFGSRPPTATSSRQAGRATPATTSSIPPRGRLQSLLVEVGLPFGDVSYYKVHYLQQ